MKKARLLITKNCVHNCKYCCNKYTSIMKDMIEIKDLNEINGMDEYIITGGEPLLFPSKVILIIKTLREKNPLAKFYLYTTIMIDYSKMCEIISLLDGVHFTLHEESDLKDFFNFSRFQDLVLRLFKNSKKSFRCYVQDTIEHEITIFPNIWTRFEIKGWIKEEDLVLPFGEKLYFYDVEKH